MLKREPVPSSQDLAERLSARGYAALLMPNQTCGAGPGDLNLEFGSRAPDLPHQQRVVDSDHRLRRDRRSWQWGRCRDAGRDRPYHPPRIAMASVWVTISSITDPSGRLSFISRSAGLAGAAASSFLRPGASRRSRSAWSRTPRRRR